MNNKVIYGAIIGVFLMLMLATGGIGSMFGFIFLTAIMYFAIKHSRKLFTSNEEYHDETDYERKKAEFLASRASTSAPQRKANGTLTQSEEDVWESLTSDMTDENFDPPIPLAWSTLNPFAPFPKKPPKKPKIKNRKY